MKDKMEMMLFYIFKYAVLILPMFARYKFAEICGIFVYYILKSRRELTIKNIKKAFPEKSFFEVKKIAKESYKNIAKTFFELLWSEKLKVEVIGMEYFLEAYKRERGIILVSLHIGNWETGGTKLAKIGYPMYPIARAQRNKIFNNELNSQRAKNGVFIIKKGAASSPRAIIKALKTKGILGLICDQYANDLKINFFNIETRVTAGPASLSLRFNAPIIIAYDIRIKNEYHKVIIEPEIVIDKEEADNENIKNGMQKIYNSFEKIIKENPEQWFWQHRRWR
jgi:Kdo2-lipid IVA lauroyltransferase/acyltransferase